MGLCGVTSEFNVEFEAVVDIICICCVLWTEFLEIKVNKKLPSTYSGPSKTVCFGYFINRKWGCKTCWFWWLYKLICHNEGE